MSLGRYYPAPKSPSEPRFKSGRCPAYLGFLRGQPCCVTGVRAGELIEVPFPNGKTGKVRAVIEASHLKTRGSSGPDLYNAVPMELSQHKAWHREGRKSFPAKRGLDLQALATEHTEWFLRLHPEYDPSAPPTGGARE